MPKAASRADLPAEPPAVQPSWRMAIALCVAGAAMLARDSRGDLVTPSLIVGLLQLPLAIVWLKSRRSPRAGKPSAFTDIGFAAAVATAGVALAVMTRSVDPALVAISGFLSGTVAVDALRTLFQNLEARIDHPIRLLRYLVPKWFACVVVSTILLALPIATNAGVPDYRHNLTSHLVNSLHAAVSAGCLVGTFTFSFADDFTRFGQIIIILLTQFCGFAFAAVGLALVRPILQRPPSLKKVLGTAAALQLTGMAIMFTAWRDDDAATLVERCWWSLVHAGSAMWNTGIMLRPDGLASYYADRRVFLTITSLAIAGSLGIPILYELLRRKDPTNTSEMSDTRLSGIATFDAFAAFLLLLFLSGALFYFEHPASIAGEWRPPLPFEPSVHQPAMSDNRNSPWPLAVLVASTTRSAGLQTIPVSIGTLSWPSYGLLIAAMFIGGGIAGTAGGIRTSLFGMLFIAPGLGSAPTIKHAARKQSLRRYLLSRFLLGLGIWLTLNWIGTWLLGATTDAARYDTTFDAIACLNNVGLTTGLAAHLTIPGRIVAIALMVMGRLWPLIFWAKTVSHVNPRT